MHIIYYNDMQKGWCDMRKFDYSFLNNGLLPANLVNLTSNISALKTMAGVRKEEYTQIFTELEAVAKVQSIKSSNAIEGIVTSDERIAAIVNQNSAPLNHNEAEIAGLDAVETQLDLLSYGSTEDHITILKQMIADMQTGKSQESLEEMVSLYKQDNREKLKIYLEQEMQETDGLSEGYITGYLDNLIKERNRNWANQITEMLQEPDKTYFIFGGAAHWLVFPSVFDMLIKDGSAVMVQ